MTAVFLTPPEIQYQALKAGQGYDRDEVDRLLEHVASSYEHVWLKREDLLERVRELERELASFRERERLISDALVTSQRAAEVLRAEARREGERLQAEALGDVGQAKSDAERELTQLRAEIERFRTLERELRPKLQAFLEDALGEIDDAGELGEAGDGTLVDALAPEPAAGTHDDG